MKTIKGKEVRGEIMCDLLNVYVAELNGKSVPVLQTGWKYVCQRECEEAV